MHEKFSRKFLGTKNLVERHYVQKIQKKNSLYEKFSKNFLCTKNSVESIYVQKSLLCTKNSVKIL